MQKLIQLRSAAERRKADKGLERLETPSPPGEEEYTTPPRLTPAKTKNLEIFKLLTTRALFITELKRGNVIEEVELENDLFPPF